MLFIKVLLSLFLSGAIFVFALYRIMGFGMKITLKKGIFATVSSVCFNSAVMALNHDYIGYGEQILFDCISMVVLALLSACIVAVVLAFMPRKTVRRILLGKRCKSQMIKVLPKKESGLAKVS